MPANSQGVVMTLSDLVVGALVPVELQTATVSGLQLDSRKVTEGDLFIAVPGHSSDGRSYIEQALAAGAVAVIAEADGLEKQHAQVIPVAGLADRVSEIAGRFYGNPSEQLKITGITGTNGKTTCAHLLGQLLSLLGAPTAMLGTLGFGVFRNGETRLRSTGMTTPDAITSQLLLATALEEGADSAVMEVSSHSLSQARVAGVSFESAVFTNLSRDHLDYHADMAEYAAAKALLFRQHGLKHAIINIDDAQGLQMASHISGETDLISYGLAENAVVRASNVQLGSGGVSADIHTPWGEGHFFSRLLGEFNVRNLLAVIAVAAAQGHSLAAILEQLPALHAAPGRLMPVLAPSREVPAVLVDYAHTPDALLQALTALRKQCQGRLWVVFGCGGDRDRGKRPEMGAIASQLADCVIITSDNPRSESPLDIMLDIAAGVKDARMIEDRAEAIHAAISEASVQDMVLIAGKGHENWQQIGDQKIPFDDSAIAAEVLAQIWGGKA